MFSVVIPTHNRLDLLKDAVETVLKQDYSDWELVILTMHQLMARLVMYIYLVIGEFDMNDQMIFYQLLRVGIKRLSWQEGIM